MTNLFLNSKEDKAAKLAATRKAVCKTAQHIYKNFPSLTWSQCMRRAWATIKRHIAKGSFFAKPVANVVPMFVREENAKVATWGMRNGSNAWS